MTTNRTRTRRPTAKQAATQRAQVVDEVADGDVAPQPAQNTGGNPLDFDLDLDVVMSALGVQPGLLVPDSARLLFVDNKIVIEYSVRRAIPPRIMGMALLAGSTHEGGSDG